MKCTCSSGIWFSVHVACTTCIEMPMAASVLNTCCSETPTLIGHKLDKFCLQKPHNQVNENAKAIQYQGWCAQKVI